MNEKKLTDEDIVKALECCTVDEVTDCENCPLLRESCAIIRKYALDFIQRLQADNDRLKVENEYLDMVAKQALTDYQNTQVQVDELTDKLGKVLSGIKADELLVAKGIEQAVKDTAKEIFEMLFNECWAIKDENGNKMFIESKIKHIAKERYGVEVE